MKRLFLTLTLIVFAAACTDKREALVSEKIKSDAATDITKAWGKSAFTEGYVSHFVQTLKVKLQSYDEVSKTATVELTSLNKQAQDSLIMAAMMTSGKLPFDEVVKLYEKESKRSIASFEPNVTTVKCQFEEKDGKEVVRSCK